MSLFKSQLINNQTLSNLSTDLNLENYIIVGKNVKINSKIKSDVFESIIGAIYLDSNLKEVERFLEINLINKIKNIKKLINYKSILINKHNNIKYNTKLIYNDAKIYISKINLNNSCYGFGINKKEAEQNISKIYLNLIN